QYLLMVKLLNTSYIKFIMSFLNRFSQRSLFGQTGRGSRDLQLGHNRSVGDWVFSVRINVNTVASVYRQTNNDQIAIIYLLNFILWNGPPITLILDTMFQTNWIE
ncbi:MAG: hypothetical protein AAFS13_08545, partial [Pseudomonadota bacterium]